MPTNTAPHAIALLRISLGAIFLAHGVVLKFMTFGLAGTMAFFGSLGYPPMLGAVVTLAEISAGLALVLGLLVRPAALLMLPILLGATLTHAGNGWVFNATGGGWEFPAFLTLATLAQAGLGAGPSPGSPWRYDGRRSSPTSGVASKAPCQPPPDAGERRAGTTASSARHPVRWPHPPRPRFQLLRVPHSPAGSE